MRFKIKTVWSISRNKYGTGSIFTSASCYINDNNDDWTSMALLRALKALHIEPLFTYATFTLVRASYTCSHSCPGADWRGSQCLAQGHNANVWLIGQPAQPPEWQSPAWIVCRMLSVGQEEEASGASHHVTLWWRRKKIGLNKTGK